ncbi:MAG: TerC/Alx family metal homeostasis membrane protein, partial [Chlorobi bacterium]|nr:TerC/Alx family metal homeostasis membrane protein [Chlorobiota bacterium]
MRKISLQIYEIPTFGQNFQMDFHSNMVLLGFLLAMGFFLALDLGVFHKKDHEIGFKEATIWTVIWISMALLAFILIYFFGEKIHGITDIAGIKEKMTEYGHPISRQLQNVSDNGTALKIYRENLALEFLTGYIVEYSLSIDNIFVIILIFASFGIEKKYYHRVLFWGILGAVAMRFLFIFLFSTLIHRFEWLLLLFGAFLVFTGVKMFLQRNKEKKIDTKNHPVIRFTARYFSVDKDYTGHNFFIRKSGKLFVSSLFIVLLIVEFSDVIFAVDSIPAIFSITKDPYIVYFSNIFAIIGLRSLFFLLINILDKFRYLNIGLSLLLVLVGVKMILPFLP